MRGSLKLDDEDIAGSKVLDEEEEKELHSNAKVKFFCDEILRMVANTGQHGAMETTSH